MLYPAEALLVYGLLVRDALMRDMQPYQDSQEIDKQV